MKYHIYFPDTVQFGSYFDQPAGEFKYIEKQELELYGLYSAEYLFSAYGKTHWHIECEPSSLTFLALKLGVVLGQSQPPTLF